MSTDPRHPSETFLRAIDIHELLPQQEPFVMIGTLTAYDEQHVATETVVAEDNIFVEDGRLASAGLIENIAQTCAARIGYVNKYILKKGIQIGFIGAIRDLRITDLPAVGERITTHVTVTEEMFGMTLAEATVHSQGRELVSTVIKMAIREGEEHQ